MSRERRRKSRLWQLVADDPYRKLVAVGLGVLLWFFINSRIMDSWSISLPLVAVDPQMSSGVEKRNQLAVELPMDRVVPLTFFDGDQEIDRVRIVLSGPRFRVDALKTDTLNLTIRTFFNRNWATRRDVENGDREIVEFTAANIRRDLRILEEVDIEMDPPLVRMEVQIRENATIPLTNERVQIVADGNEDRLMLETARYTPPEAKVLGPAIGIDRLEASAKWFRAELKVSGNDTKASAQLTIIDGPERGLYFDSIPRIEVQLRPRRAESTLTLPVVVDDASLPPELRGQYYPDVESRSVVVSFSGSLANEVGLRSPEALRQWAADSLRLEVHVPRTETRNELELQPYLTAAGSDMQKYERSEYLLVDKFAVTLRKKQQ